MVVASAGRHCFNRDVGMGSSSHCLFEADLIILVISSPVAGWKQERSAGLEGGPGTWENIK